MQITDNSSVNWSERIKSDSRNVDLLGIWSQHLKIQVDFTPGITSVTTRIRYYTLIAYYFEYLKNIVPDRYNFERIFILSCLAHHDGDDKPLEGVHNKTKFKGKWDEKNEFNLNFKITGQGWSYYVRQLEILRCAWKDEFGVNRFSKINTKLAKSLENIHPWFFRNKIFKKDKLKEVGENGLCICNTGSNINEKDIMSKLLFGFFSKNSGEWDIDKEEYLNFKKGLLNLNFENLDNSTFLLDDEIIVKNLKRRNTLFMFLKIVYSTNPTIDSEYKRYIWDATYFNQNRETHDSLDFGKLEHVKKYWELLQLNVYYIYALEMYLGLIDDIILNYIEINENEVLNYLDMDYFYSYLGNKVNEKINHKYALKKFIKTVDKVNQNSKTNLNSLINESEVYDEISSTESEDRLANILLMISLLFNRYLTINKKIKDYSFQDYRSEPYSLFIEDIFEYIRDRGHEITIFEFLKFLSDLIIKRHLYESTLRLYDSGTKNWLFTEEDSFLFSENKNIYFYARDNRWNSIRSLLLDLGFINIHNNSLELSERGIKWLKRVE